MRTVYRSFAHYCSLKTNSALYTSRDHRAKATAAIVRHSAYRGKHALLHKVGWLACAIIGLCAKPEC
jgi:hypothetical protein